MTDYLTTSEVASLLRIKERKVYDLASSGALPCSKAIGKLLFPRDQIEAWIAANAPQTIDSIALNRPSVALGSLDPLLEWSLRESASGIAMLFDGSADGLRRFSQAQGILAGLHIHDAATDTWNVRAIEQQKVTSAVLIEWATRQRGLILRSGLDTKIRSINDLVGHTVVPRQVDAGAQAILINLLNQHGVSEDAVLFTSVARTEHDLGETISRGQADAGLGLASIAALYQLPFVPLIDERYDLLVDRKHFFEPPFQQLLAFAESTQFQRYARSLTGYDTNNLGRVHLNTSV